ncbi:MAG: hypothetical protein KAJ47_03535, partial [Candidatus Aenigmarchaeota archaeon]|nr:hypothetical protein [Candidatus Aenigmarchaeota archaeon]
QYEGIKNFNIAVKEKDGDVIFLRRIVEGGTDRSYGIEVAKLAGLPKAVLDRSREIMDVIENDDKVSARIDHRVKDRNVSVDMRKPRPSSVPMSLRKFARS